MMKKFVLILFLFISAAVYSQAKEIQSQDSTKVYEKVEKLAEFPGGINEFRNQFTKIFRAEKLKEKGLIKTLVTFVVEKDGSVNEVRALGGSQSFNDESIRAIKKIKGKWIPAEFNGEKVRFRFRLPLTMSFE